MCVISILLVYFSLCLVPIKAGICVNYIYDLQTRTFDNFYEFHQNNMSFFDGDESYNGNDVVFKDDHMTNISANAFVTYDAENIRRISLNGKQIQLVEAGAFSQLDCLFNLDLSNNSISEITKMTFIGLVFLREFNLSENLLEEIPNYSFTLLSRLRTLSLSKNRLRVLHQNSFFKLWLLQYLDLSNNYLTTVPEESLQYFRSLYDLQLGSNRIESLSWQNWRAGENLATLNLTNNALRRFSLSIEYSFQYSLRTLDLSNNYLTNLFLTELRRRFPFFKSIDLNDNFWNCTELLKITKYLTAIGINVGSGNTETLPNVDRIACDRPRVAKWNGTFDPNIVLEEETTGKKSSVLTTTMTTIPIVTCGLLFIVLCLVTHCCGILKNGLRIEYPPLLTSWD